MNRPSGPPRRSFEPPKADREPVPPVLRIAALIWAIVAGAIAIGCLLAGAWPAALAEIGIVMLLTTAMQRSAPGRGNRD